MVSCILSTTLDKRPEQGLFFKHYPGGFPYSREQVTEIDTSLVLWVVVVVVVLSLTVL